MAYEINDKLFHIEHSLGRHVYRKNQEAKISNYNYGGSLAIVVVHVPVEWHACTQSSSTAAAMATKTTTK